MFGRTKPVVEFNWKKLLEEYVMPGLRKEAEKVVNAAIEREHDQVFSAIRGNKADLLERICALADYLGLTFEVEPMVDRKLVARKKARPKKRRR